MSGRFAQFCRYSREYADDGSPVLACAARRRLPFPWRGPQNRQL